MIKIKNKYEMKDSISFNYNEKIPLEERVSEVYKKAGRFLIDISDKLASDTIEGSSLAPLTLKIKLDEDNLITIEKETKYLIMEVE
ncbi:hypothetical protein IC216_06065 [Clostridioides sp. ES-S-0145-01]|nr:hypothetical protein [Clostridioides sp. ES-S-0145-01]